MNNFVRSALPHENEKGRQGFRIAVTRMIWAVREQFDLLGRVTWADAGFTGAIRALRKAVEGDGPIESLGLAEVESWEKQVTNWWNKVHREVPSEIQEQRITQIRNDLNALKADANRRGAPDPGTRYLYVKTESPEDNKSLRIAADRIVPVRLGSALHEYLQRCLESLRQGRAELPALSPELEREEFASALRFHHLYSDQKHTISVENFQHWGEDVTGYDLEAAARSLLVELGQDLQDLVFDTESSALVAMSSHPAAILALATAITSLDEDRSLRDRLLPKPGTG